VARKRDYAKEYARRQELAIERGFTGYQEERRYKERLRDELREFGYPEPEAVLEEEEPPVEEPGVTLYSWTSQEYEDLGADRWRAHEDITIAERERADGSHWEHKLDGIPDENQANVMAYDIAHGLIDPAEFLEGGRGEVGAVHVELEDDGTYTVVVDAYVVYVYA